MDDTISFFFFFNFEMYQQVSTGEFEYLRMRRKMTINHSRFVQMYTVNDVFFIKRWKNSFIFYIVGTINKRKLIRSV